MRARSVTCPICKAKPEEACRDGVRTLPWRASHEARVRAAKEATS